jgi:hypothetical protein
VARFAFFLARCLDGSHNLALVAIEGEAIFPGLAGESTFNPGTNPELDEKIPVRPLPEQARSRPMLP